MFPVPSYADITTLIKLIDQIITFIISVNSSSSECHLVILELRSVSNSVSAIVDLLNKLSTNNSPETQGLLRALRGDIERCNSDVEEFAKWIRPYHKLLCSGPGRESGWSVKAVGGRLKWVLFHQKEAVEAKERVLQHRGHILTLYNALAGTQSNLMCSQMMKQIGTPYVEIIDPLGRKLMWEYRSCDTWENFNRTLKSNMSGTPFQYHIQAGLFIVLNERDKAITSSRWPTFVRPGSRLNIYLTLEHYNHISQRDRDAKGNCPRCWDQLPEMKGFKMIRKILKSVREDGVEEHSLVVRLTRKRGLEDGEESDLGRISCFSPTPIVRQLGLRTRPRVY